MLDIEKYGFKQTKYDGEYLCSLNGRKYLLLNYDKTYSLRHLGSKSNMYIFNRYEIDTQEQLDFLMLNGRVGWFFRHILQTKNNVV